MIYLWFMNSSEKSAKKNEQLIKAVAVALNTKKEIKTRMEKGENLRKVAKEKGIKIVLPL